MVWSIKLRLIRGSRRVASWRCGNITNVQRTYTPPHDTRTPWARALATYMCYTAVVTLLLLLPHRAALRQRSRILDGMEMFIVLMALVLRAAAPKNHGAERSFTRTGLADDRNWRSRKCICPDWPVLGHVADGGAVSVADGSGAWCRCYSACSSSASDWYSSKSGPSRLEPVVRRIWAHMEYQLSYLVATGLIAAAAADWWGYPKGWATHPHCTA